MPSIKKWNLFIYFVIFMVLSTAGKAVTLVTDYWWFQGLGFTEIFTKTLSAQLALGIGAAVLAWAVVLPNWRSARRASYKSRLTAPPGALWPPRREIGSCPPSPLPRKQITLKIAAPGTIPGLIG